jgi:hypothetical protein
MPKRNRRTKTTLEVSSDLHSTPSFQLTKSSLRFWQIALGLSSAFSIGLLALIASQSKSQPVRSRNDRATSGEDIGTK